MKSIKVKKQAFTMEDFEKGLVLAGYVTPATIGELHEREVIDEYEKSLKGEKPIKDNIFFKRVTLAAEIAAQLHGEPTFGRVKFQKLVYLCENVALMDLNERYSKQAAGPFDNKFMHSIETQFKKNNWFEVEKKSDGKFQRSVYIPLEKWDGYKKYYASYFNFHNERIQYIIDLFRKEKTDKTEISATLYACLIELHNENDLISEKSLLNKFYDWSIQKARFERNTVIETWKWMQEKGVVPFK